jgi:7-cyano-7-deazaguanine reductase
VESKSLKLYLHSFRNVGSFAEAVTNRILDDLVRALAPRQAVVTGEFAARGGVALKVSASSGREK